MIKAVHIKKGVQAARAMIFRDRPVYAHYGITHRCNLKCRMCKTVLDQGKEELSFEQVKKLAAFLKSAGIIYVSIGGGEPCLRSDLTGIVDMLIKSGFAVRLLTNGTLMEEPLLKELIRTGLREISISLDSLQEARQDYICQSALSWQKIMKSLHMIAPLLEKEKGTLLINTVVSSLNILELKGLVDFSAKQHCLISFVPVEQGSPADFSFSPGDRDAIEEGYRYLLERKKAGTRCLFNSSRFLEVSREYLQGEKRSWHCDAGSLYFSINPNGEISFCHQAVPLFSALSPDALTTLRAQETREKQARHIKQCSGCARPCWAEVSLFSRDARSQKEGIRKACRSFFNTA